MICCSFCSVLTSALGVFSSFSFVVLGFRLISVPTLLHPTARTASFGWRGQIKVQPCCCCCLWVYRNLITIMFDFNLSRLRDVFLIKTTVAQYFKLVLLSRSCVTSLFQTCVKCMPKESGIKIQWEKKNTQTKTTKRKKQPLWFLSGLIYSPLMPF